MVTANPYQQKPYGIGFILLIVACLVMGCCSHGDEPTQPIQGTLVATVTTYKEARLSGTVPRGTQVRFFNSSQNSGRVGEADTATMTITGLPQGWITLMTVHLHSNKNSGAGECTLTIGDSTYLHYEGTLAQWVGDYSTTDVPLSTTGAVIAYNQQSIQLTIIGTKSSLYLSRLEIQFTTIEPPCDTIYLSYWDANIKILDTLWETVAGAGIQLPTCPTIHRIDSDWVHVGWVKQAVVDTLYQPAYWSYDMTYYAAHGQYLWALYQYSSKQVLHQDSSFQSGEYALVRNSGMIARGGWKNNTLDNDTLSVFKEANAYYCWVDSVAEDNRYYLDFDMDSVTIQVLSESYGKKKVWLGYNGAYTSVAKTSWAWHRTGEGSIFFYHDKSHIRDSIMGEIHEYDQAYNIAQTVNGRDTIFAHKLMLWDISKTYWLLFPTTNIQTSACHRWTTHP